MLTNSVVYEFTRAEGLVPGTEYHVRVRARNFYSYYYDKHTDVNWSAISVFFSSDLPKTVPALTFDSRTKTGATVHWSHHSDAEDMGHSSIEPYYLLWVDNCQGSEITNLLVNSTTAMQYSITNIPPGSTCRFKMNVLNVIGYSQEYTTVLPVLMASIPDAPLQPLFVERSGGMPAIGL